jgi:vacuolar protein sorting-associated protein 54
VQVPSRFQDIVGQLEERGGTAAASQPGAATGNGTAVGGVSDGTANGAAGEGQLPRKFTITPPERSGEPVAATLAAGGRAFHVVNTQLLLLASFREYLAFRDAVPAFRAEVAQRVLELLKVFNSRTCQLVLGAGAMQVRIGAAGWRLLSVR